MEKPHRIKNVQECTDTSDCIEVSRTSGLYLKPIARLSITVTLPQLKSGQSISNWEVMEKLRAAIMPEVFSVIKVTKSTLEFLRFDAEIENKKNLAQVISKIDQKGIKLSGFSELLKIRATEAKVPFPSRHDWDSFFRDAKHMNEMKPGERPDTVHFQDLPCRWFMHIGEEKRNLPSSYVLSKVMSSFGEVRIVDIPICDPYRKKMSASINGIKTFSFGQELVFEAYVQFKEYIGFAKCMHALQGKKLVFVENDKAYSANIKVDFDKTKHLSEYSIKKRQNEREKLLAEERELEEKVRRKLEFEEMKRETERLQLEEEQRKKEERKEAKRKEKEARRKTREEKRRANRMEKEEERLRREQEEEEAKFARKIALEERKLLIAQRKLESIRLLDELFERIKVDRQKKIAQQRETELFDHVDKESSKKLKEIKKKELKDKRLQEKMALKEKQLRDKLVKSYKSKEEDRMELQREKVRKAVQGQVRVQSGISLKSLSSISSATSESGSDISSDTDSGSSSSMVKTADPKLLLGRMYMDHVDEENHGEMGQQNHHHMQDLPYYHSYYDKFGYQEGHNYPEEWGYDAYDRGRGRGRGRWRYPRGPWRGRGFRDRGRGFRDRGHGFRGSWQGSSFSYDESKKPLESHKPKTTWYKRGETYDDDDDDKERSRSRSRHRRSHSRSRSRRSRSRSRSRRSRSRSRSRRSHSRSRSRSKRSRSKSKSKRSRSHSVSRSRSRSKSKGSHSRSKRSRSVSKSRSNKSHSKERSRSRNSRSRSKSDSRRSRSKSRSRSRKRSRSRSRKRSRSHSRSRSRTRSRSKKRRHSSSEEHSSHSSSRRRDKHRSERHRERDYGRKTNSDQVDYDELRESDLDLSSDPEDRYQHDPYPDEGGEEVYSGDYYYRGSGWRGYQPYMRGPRGGRWPRGWRGRGRGWGYSTYPDYHEHDSWRQNEQNSEDQYRDMYQKYFESLNDREASEKHKGENVEEERRSQPEYDLKEKKRFTSRDRETVSRSDERNYPPKEPLRHRNIPADERFYTPRKAGVEKGAHDSVRAEVDVKRNDNSKNFTQRSKESQESESRRGYEVRDRSRRGQSQEGDSHEHSRSVSHSDDKSHHKSYSGREDYNDYKSKAIEGSNYEEKTTKSSHYDDPGIDERWKTQVMRADLERKKGSKKEISVKDRLSFAPVKKDPSIVHIKKDPSIVHIKKDPGIVHVKKDPGIVHIKYDPGYNYKRKPTRRNEDDPGFTIESRRHIEEVKMKGKVVSDHFQGRIDNRAPDFKSSRDDHHKDLRERHDVKMYNREGRHNERSENKVGRDYEKRNVSASSESDNESDNEKSAHRKRNDSESSRRKGKESYDSESSRRKGKESYDSESSRRKGKESYDSERNSEDDDDSDSDSQHDSHQRKRGRSGKKKRSKKNNDRKHKHKKKKKKKDSRRD